MSKIASNYRTPIWKCQCVFWSITVGTKEWDKQNRKKIACHQFFILYHFALVFDSQIDFDWHSPPFISDIYINVCLCDTMSALYSMYAFVSVYRHVYCQFQQSASRIVFRINFIRATLQHFFFRGASRVAILYE